MPATRKAAHVGWGMTLGVALLAGASACQVTDDNGIEQTDGAVAFGPGGGVTGAGVAGGGVTGGGLVDGGVIGGGITGGGTTTGGTTGGGGFPGGLLGGLGLDAGLRDAAVPRTDAAVVADASPVGDGGDPYADLRQVCVDTINMYRATVAGLAPLARANAAQEECSDRGAKYDGDLNKGKPPNQVVGHASTHVPGLGPDGGVAPLCGSVGLLGIQNACPGWPVGPGTGNATLADALKNCLKSMWAEGEPPEGVKACKDAYLLRQDGACFLKYGHWISMADPTNRTVSCGFYDMGGNKFWMNQDFVGGR